MRRPSLIALAVAALVLLLVVPAGADRGPAVPFATLPSGPGHPEGIAADADGNIYAASFEFSGPNVIYVLDTGGRLKATIPFPGLPLGMAFDATGNLYVANFGGGSIVKYAPPFTSSSTPTATYPVCTFAFGVDCGLNAIAFDAAGDLYVSDSFGGRVRRLNLPVGISSIFFSDDRLKPGSHAFPPFGANGLAFDAAGTALYIANTADDRILKLALATLTLTTFAESVNGPDGILFDPAGRLWAAANQGDEVVALNASGRIVERRGAFEGIGPDGAARGLIFPASIVLSRGSLYVTNAALVLTGAVGDEPEEDVTAFTVSRIPLGRP